MNRCPTARNRRFPPPALPAAMGVLLRLLLCLLPLTAVSCAWLHPKRDFSPPVRLPEKFSASGAAAAPDKWWTALGDQNLNKLIEQALAGNFSLQSTWARLAQARATVRGSSADLWPTLDGGAGAERSRTVTVVRQRDGTSRRNTVLETDLSLGLDISYEVDLWGRVRSTRDAAALDLLATREDLHAAAITLSGEVADTWYQLLEQRRQLKLLAEQVKTNRDYLELITLRFRHGQVGATDVLQQRQLLESTQGEIAQSEAIVKVLGHELAILLGRSPKERVAPDDAKLPALPPLPNTGLPADLVQRRPDVRSTRMAVQAADKRVAAAIADCFPRISLTATGDTSAQYLRNLFDNWVATMAANLAAPIFDGGERLAEVDRTKAAASESLNDYAQVVLDALGEVEDALAQEAQQQKYVKSLGEQVDLSRQSTEQTRENYMKGAGNFLRFLTTLLSHQRLQRTHLQARRELIQFRIDLYRALGGSWQMKQPRPAGGSSRAKEPASKSPLRPRS